MEENKENYEKEKNFLNANESRAKIMLEELKLKYQSFNNSNLKEDKIIKKIIELNFDEYEIKKYIDVVQLIQKAEGSGIGSRGKVYILKKIFKLD